MTVTLNSQLLEAASSHVGAPFHEHYAVDLCQRGRVTLPQCMDAGLGQDGAYDCSGLVVASMCEVVDIDPAGINPSVRHPYQIGQLPPINRERRAGDIVVFHGFSRSDQYTEEAPQHVGVYTGEDELVIQGLRHSKISRLSGFVAREVLVSQLLVRQTYVAPEILLEVLFS